jgi:hypothetical protein
MPVFRSLGRAARIPAVTPVVGPRPIRAVLLSLADFAATAWRPRTPLARAIVCALAIKLVVIVSMKLFLFSGDARPVVDEAAIARLVGPATHAPQ